MRVFRSGDMQRPDYDADALKCLAPLRDKPAEIMWAVGDARPYSGAMLLEWLGTSAFTVWI